jgi:hypothetical protein
MSIANCKLRIVVELRLNLQFAICNLNWRQIWLEQLEK